MPQPAWRRYLRFWRPDLRADVDDELRFHLDMRERDYRDAGLTDSAAHDAALRRFGNVAAVQATLYRIGHEWERDMKFSELLAGIRQDATYALRQLARNRAFAGAAALTLALGIGANSLVFSLVDALVLRPMPAVRDPARVVEVTRPSLSYPAYQDIRRATDASASLAAFSYRQASVADGDRAELVTMVAVSDNYFDVLGVPPARGRLLAPSDDAPGAAPVAVVSERYWGRFFGRDTAIVGRSVKLNGVAVTIVGVSGAGFEGTRLGGDPAFWIALRRWPDVAPPAGRRLDVERRGWSWLTMVGRIRPGATSERVLATIGTAAQQQLATFPNETGPDIRDIQMRPATQAAISGGGHDLVVRFMAVLAGVVAIVLLIACANIANLLLSRAAGRRREIGVRLALGAGRGRLVRQLLTETLVLALIAAALGLGVMRIGMIAVARVSVPGGFAFASLDLHTDPRVVAFTIVVALLASMIFGLAPALESTRPGVVDALRDGGREGGRSKSRLRSALLVAQVALSLMLLIGAGLFTRSLQRALATDLGFDGTAIATASVNLGLVRYDAPRAARFFDEVTRRISRIPGVKSAGWGMMLPLSPETNTEGMKIDGYVPKRGERLVTEVNVVTGGYFRAFRQRIVRGRVFDERDDAQSPPAIVVNETFVHRYLADGDPLGRRISILDTPFTVIGVVRDIKYHELREEPRPYVYGNFTQLVSYAGLYPATLVAHVTGDPDVAAAGLARALVEYDPVVPVFGIGTFDDLAGQAVVPQRVGASVLGAFGVVAMIIAAVGVYGVVAYGVSQRTREFGVRMALGASGSGVLRLVVAENLVSVAIGLAIGLVLAGAATRALESLLYGISPTDALTFSGASVMLLVVALVAAFVPARRATRVDPVSALRAD